jgi:hypothetical protein
MYARWLIAAETLAVGMCVYCASVAGELRFEGIHTGFDESFDPASRISYFLWQSRAREVLLFLTALWVTSIVLAVYAKTRAHDTEYVISKCGSRGAISIALILPLAGVLGGLVFGLEIGLGW